jgi:hypothetical protein
MVSEEDNELDATENEGMTFIPFPKGYNLNLNADESERGARDASYYAGFASIFCDMDMTENAILEIVKSKMYIDHEKKLMELDLTHENKE